MDLYRAHVLVCAGTGCTSAKSPQIMMNFETELLEKGLTKEVKIVKTGCFGLCAEGPIVMVYPEGVMYYRVSPKMSPKSFPNICSKVVMSSA